MLLLYLCLLIVEVFVALFVPFTKDTNQRNVGPRHPYLKRVNIAYDFASAELLNLIIHKVI
jgi:hypothetical protein